MKINYQLELEKIINENKNKKLKLLLHSCCAPCSSYVMLYLAEFFDITILYYNPNIDKEEEYKKRAIEQKKVIDEMELDIKFIEKPYNSKEFYQAIKGYEQEKEGGERCFLCYKLRMEKTAELSKKEGFDYFGTVLTISPLKNATKINEIGKELEKKYGANYLYSDFKKKEGYKKSVELSRKYNLYRQDYCGCSYSKIERNEKIKGGE